MKSYHYCGLSLSLRWLWVLVNSPVYSLCDDYEVITEKALTTPANTEQLIELKEYIEKVLRFAYC